MKKTQFLRVVFIIIIVSISSIWYFKTINIKNEDNTKMVEIQIDNVSLLTSNTLGSNEENGIIYSYQEYLYFANNKVIENSDEIKEESFNNNNYIYQILEYDECKEEVSVKSLTVYEKEALITFNIEYKNEICQKTSKIYMIPVDKNVKITTINYYYYYNGLMVEKPILYLYPKQTTNVTVKLEHNNTIITSYPKYQNGWNITAHPNGDLYDSNNKYYYALYWDEKNNHKVDFQKGFYVTKDNAISFLEEKLTIIGLNNKERNEFIMYWLPILEKNEKSLVYFELTEERENNNKLIINPIPDSILRISIHIKKVKDKVDIEEQQLTTFKRNGFVAVEWGGINY